MDPQVWVLTKVTQHAARGQYIEEPLGLCSTLPSRVHFAYLLLLLIRFRFFNGVDQLEKIVIAVFEIVQDFVTLWRPPYELHTLRKRTQPGRFRAL